MSNLLILDLETTGVISHKCDIIDICASYYEGKTLISSYSSTVRPYAYSEISLEALKVNKASLSSLKFPQQGEESSKELVIVNFIQWLISLNIDTKNTYLCGHNVDFDLSFIEAACADMNIVDIHAVIPRKKYDTMSLTALLQRLKVIDLSKVEPINKDRGTLSKLATALNIDLTNYNVHTATGDVKLIADIIFKIEDLLAICLYPDQKQS